MTEVDAELSHQSLPFAAGRLAQPLYLAEAVRAIEHCAIERLGIPGYALMQRAAQAAWQTLRRRWPDTQQVVVICGPGNNGGDGYEIARLARSAGVAVQLFEPLRHTARGDALIARTAWLADGGDIADRLTESPIASSARKALDRVIVDALFGTGLSRAPDAAALAAIHWINQAREQGAGVLAVDVPSGLSSDRGTVLGAAVQADVTATFVARKPGLYTGQGAAYSGAVAFDDLQVPTAAYDVAPAVAELQQRRDLRHWLPPRRRTAHKGDNGHVLIVGGDHGTTGAILLCARACLRAGAGLVTVATRREHALALTAAQPELMGHGVDSAAELAPLLARANVVAIGPGLGQSDWARSLLDAVDASGKPQVADADALNLLAQQPNVHAQRVLTPHPGEAARLLGVDNQTLQADRIGSARALQQRYGGVVVLKGAGTLVAGETMQLCPFGNPGMGVGGMGDALTGIISALMAQRLPLEVAANAGVLVHALAGDRAATQGERGLLPGDLIEQLRSIVNP